MKFTSIVVLAGSLAFVQGALEPYSQCGGGGWKYDWVCPTGYFCKNIPTTYDTNSYRCQPDNGPAWSGSREWGQCGGQTWPGPTKCPPGWQCNRNNDYFSTCGAIPGYEWPPSSTPGLAAPGDYCGPYVGANAPDCVPGYVCTQVGKVDGYCLLDTSSSSTSAIPSSTTLVVVTTTVIKTTTASATPTKEYPPTTKSVKTTPTKEVPPSPTTKSVKTTTTSKSSEFPGVPPWGVCGGNNHTGGTKCTEGWTCVRLSEWFSQCLKR